MKIQFQGEIKTTLLGKALLEKRGNRPLREVAGELNVSIATLNRMERGGTPDLSTFEIAMRWLKIPNQQWPLYMDMRQF